MIIFTTVCLFLIVFFFVRKLTNSYILPVIAGSVKSTVYWFVANAAARGSFKSDDLDYWVRSARFDDILRDWQRFVLEPELAWGGGHWGYYLVNWFARQVFLDSPVGPIFFNSIIGVISSILVYLLARGLTDHTKFAAYAGTAFMVMPESLVWSSYNFKDSWVQMLTLGYIYFVLKISLDAKSWKVPVLAALAVLVAVAVWPFRWYIPPVMIISLGFWLMIFTGRSIVANYRLMATGIVVFLIGSLWMLTYMGACPGLVNTRCGPSNPDVVTTTPIPPEIAAKATPAVRPTATPVSHRDRYQPDFFATRAAEEIIARLATQDTQLLEEVEPPAFKSDSELNNIAAVAVLPSLESRPPGSTATVITEPDREQSETPGTVAPEVVALPTTDAISTEPPRSSASEPTQVQPPVGTPEATRVRVVTSTPGLPAVSYEPVVGTLVAPKFNGLTEYIRGMAKIVTTPRPWGIFDPYWPQLLPSSIINWLLLPFAPIGVYFAIQRRRENIFVFAYALLIMTLLTMFTNLIGPRQRFMIYPVLFISEAYAIKIAFDYYRLPKTRSTYRQKLTRGSAHVAGHINHQRVAKLSNKFRKHLKRLRKKSDFEDGIIK